MRKVIQYFIPLYRKTSVILVLLIWFDSKTMGRNLMPCAWCNMTKNCYLHKLQSIAPKAHKQHHSRKEERNINIALYV